MTDVVKRTRGRPVNPTPYKVKMIVALSERGREVLRDVADMDGLTMQEAARRFVYEGALRRLAHERARVDGMSQSLVCDGAPAKVREG